MSAQLDTLTLTGWQLDYFTGLALGHGMLISNDGAGPAYLADSQFRAYEPSRNPTDLFAVMQRMATMIQMGTAGKQSTMWTARAVGSTLFAADPALSVAVCRALVLSVLGPVVSLPGVTCVADCGDLFA